MEKEGFVTLYAPHPGFGGASAPLPLAMKEKVDALDGEKMKLKNAIEVLSNVAESLGGIIKLDRKGRCIFLIINPNSLPRHIWRLIHYK